jgi:hypothetical protein
MRAQQRRISLKGLGTFNAPALCATDPVAAQLKYTAGIIYPFSPYACGPTTDCSDWATYLFTPACWQTAHQDWVNIAAGRNPPLPSLPAPGVVNVPPPLPSDQTGTQAQQTVSDVTATSMTNTQANLQAFFNSLGPNPAGNPYDCTDPLTFVMNPSQCWPSWLPWAIGGVVLLVGFGVVKAVL